MRTMTEIWRARTFLLGVALALSLPVACRSVSTPSTGGETHFLRLCGDDDPAACGADLTCVCNVCTVSCADDDACSGLAGAVCVERSASAGCGESSETRVCEVECLEDDDCSPLSEHHRCDQGVCRSSQGVAPAPESDAAPVVPAPDPSDAAANACTPRGFSADELLLIGDSFFAASHEITRQLEALARSAGFLSSANGLRDHSRLVDNALALNGTGIANQYGAAVMESAVRAVIMNGGGADAIWGSCETPDTSCPVFVAAAAAAEELLARMHDDGVLDVVYAFYPNPVDGAQRARVDALRPSIQAVCEEAPLRCHWLDLRPAFEGHYDEYIEADGLNPTLEGATVAAGEIWSALEAQCVVPKAEN